MKKIIFNNREYWYRQEKEDVYILFEKTNYFYLVNMIIIDVIEYLANNKSLLEITEIINKKYHINITVDFLVTKLKNIEGIINE
ncbi:MAG: hypothetical protein PHR26_03990 [Candidatus ainarchaeum sp.]|nr:hypothetical protein [Candidatus ainarchaeum sp.]MDD3976102.1 hypothetical protein [Candidatus ainarchaeum sp.]